VDAHPPLHRALEPLAPLVGTWRGTGSGRYPGIEDFGYGEEVRFWHYGRPVLAYSQRTWSPGSGAPMHSEMGYWRPVGEGGVEVVLAHAFGIVEIQDGRIDGGRITMSSRSLTSAPTANRVEAVSRAFVVEGDVLAYELHMAFGDEELQPHLAARLDRVSE
jgi:hypothetical protein